MTAWHCDVRKISNVMARGSINRSAMTNIHAGLNYANSFCTNDDEFVHVNWPAVNHRHTGRITANGAVKQWQRQYT